MDAGNDSAETYLRGGIVAYEDRRLDEAAELFGKAVAIDPESAQAHLALGAARLTQYIRGCRPPSTDYVFGNHEVSEADWYAYEEERSAFIAQQNATNWPLAEKSLKKANQLDPQNKLIVQYICVLYSFWKDPLTEESGRADEAICWLERLAELDPTDYEPNLSCATLLTMGARKLLPNYGRFPALPEPDLPSLRTKVGPLLDEASRHLTLAAEKLRSDQQRAGLQYFVDEIASMRIYLIDPEQATREAYDKAMELYRKHSQPGGTAQTEAGITFTLTAEGIGEDIARPFPPNPWRIPLK